MGQERDPEEEESERPRPKVVDKRRAAGGTQPPPEPRVDAEAEPPGAPEAAPPQPSSAEGRRSPQGAAPREPTGGPAAPPRGEGVWTPQQEAGGPSPPAGGVWTPEQEAEAMRIAQEIAQAPALEWVVQAAVNLANVAGAKLELGAPADAQLAIDALAGIMNSVGHRLGGAEQILRQTLAQLQLAYAQRVAPPPKAPE